MIHRRLLTGLLHWLRPAPVAANTAAAPASNPFEVRDRFRFESSAPFLSGTGIEIGGGAFPSLLPPSALTLQYDLRDAEELSRLFGGARISPVRPLSQIRADFPDGAPFLIAHNVLEHTPDPIGTLIEWHRYVTDGGIVILSLPDKNACPDRHRLEPPFEHLLLDYALKRDQHAFESREHLAAFGLAWISEDEERGRQTAEEAARHMLPDQMEPNADAHWHAFTQSLSERTVLAACALDGRSAELLTKLDFTTTPTRTIGDIILIYRLQRGGARSTGFNYSIGAEFGALREKLVDAVKRLGSPSRQVEDEIASSLLQGEPEEVYPAWLDRSDRPPIVDLHPPFVREVGFCFQFTGLFASVAGDSESHPQRSSFRLFEDGVALGPAHALHADIRYVGGGRFSHWRNALYFSTSDNSDPNRNGRKYELRHDDLSREVDFCRGLNRDPEKPCN